MRFPRFLSHASLVAPLVLAFTVLTPTVSASPSPSPSKALVYARPRECVACAADIMARDFGDLTFYWNGARGRNANTFPARCERAENCELDSTPTVGSVMYEPVGRYGHVAVVREVFTDGSFKVEECNYVRGRKTTRVLSYREGLKFMHPKPTETIVVATAGVDTVMVASAEVRSRDPKYVLPESAISSSDEKEDCRGPHSRFCKVPRYLVPMYEATAEKYDLPVRYLAADGSYETGFNARSMSDHGTSCGLHSFRDTKRSWRNWGFNGLADCLDPEKNIDKAGEYWRKMIDQGRTLSAAIKKHNGAGAKAEAYMRAVMTWGDAMYAS